MEREEFINLYLEISTLEDRISELKEEQKGIKADIKEGIENFAKNNDKTKNQIKRYLSLYAILSEDEQEFNTMNAAFNEVLDLVTINEDEE